MSLQQQFRPLILTPTGAKFEPREEVKGDVARAVFYFNTIYNDAADQAFFEEQLADVLIWATTDIADIKEVTRSWRISEYQENVNPFLIDQTLHQRLFGTGTDVDTGEVPREYRLEQNYPNPFNPQTTIRYSLTKTVPVDLSVYNVLGERVATLVEGIQLVGQHTATFDASGLSSGMYFYRITAGDFAESMKMILLR